MVFYFYSAQDSNMILSEKKQPQRGKIFGIRIELRIKSK